MDRAFLVGINAYPGCPLQGCVNDVVNIADLLVQQFHFDPGAIRMLTDTRATTSEIFSRLNWLVAGARSGDRILFWYSGHGTQVATRNPQQEVDGLDEVICPVDFDWSDAHMIRDKQFVQVFTSMCPGVLFNWGSDSCHSGDLDRGMSAPSFLGFGNPVRLPVMIPRAYPVPADMAWRNRVASNRSIKPRAVNNGVLDVGFLPGCKSNQTSSDTIIDGKPSGAMTGYFLKVMRTPRPQPLALNEIGDQMCNLLAQDHYVQVPIPNGTRVSKPWLG